MKTCSQSPAMRHLIAASRQLEMIFVLFWIIKFVYQLGDHIRHRSVDTALVLPHQSHTSHLTLTPQWETWRGQVVSVNKTLKSDLWKTVKNLTLHYLHYSMSFHCASMQNIT